MEQADLFFQSVTKYLDMAKQLHWVTMNIQSGEIYPPQQPAPTLHKIGAL